MPVFMLADVLRSVHYGLPLSLSASECLSHPTAVSVAALSIYKAVFESQALPSRIGSRDGPLLCLIAILADIHIYAHVFCVLGRYPAPSGTQAADLKGESLRVSTEYMPFSPSNESHLMNRRLDRALELWARSYLGSSDQHTKVLYYFCKLYLTFPAVQTLPGLADYPPRVLMDGKPTQAQKALIDADLRNAPAVSEYAWLILEHTDQTNLEVTPAWLPIAVFYASLVVWQTVLVQVGSQRYASRKVLLLFRAELLKMCWPCCKSMAATLEKLTT